MALSVEFAIADDLSKSLDTLRQNLPKYRGVIVEVEKETLTAGSDLCEASENLEADFAQLRSALAGKEAALVVLSIDARLTLVTFTPESIKPRQRMIYAASSSRIRDHAKIIGDTHISAIEELSPKLFGHKETDRVVLRSDAEVQKDKIAEMQAKELKDGPQRAHAMHSMSTTVSGDALAAAKAVVASEISVAVLAMQTGSIVLESKVPKSDSIDTVTVPADEPRFLLVRSDDRVVLAYVVPEGCKPKIRMQYATTKASLVAELKNAGLSIDRSVECDSLVALPKKIEAAFTIVAADDDTAQPEAPAKKAFMKGPRMFMPGQ